MTDAQKCNGTGPKFSAVRAKMAATGTSGTVVWNTGWPGASRCFVSAAGYGEHLVMYEARLVLMMAGLGLLAALRRHRAG